MKQMLFLLLLVACVSAGCKTATPPAAKDSGEKAGAVRESAVMERFAMDNGMQRKIITRCDNDLFCFRKTVYDVSWTSSEQADCGNSKLDCGGWNRGMGENYPVSYRSSEYVYANDPNGYAVALPAGGNVIRLHQDPKGGAVHE